LTVNALQKLEYCGTGAKTSVFEQIMVNAIKRPRGEAKCCSALVRQVAQIFTTGRVLKLRAPGTRNQN
jgi:hypothetical protein